MYKLLLFLKNIHTVLLFIVLEVVAGYVFFGSNPYQKAIALNASNKVMGTLYEQTSATVNFFGLSAENERLASENAYLRQQLSSMVQPDSIEHSTLVADKYIAARVIRNSTAGQNNFITLNKGRREGMEPEMALLNNDGIVGYILDCSENFSVAISILNYCNFRTSGKLKDTDNTGNITWDGHDYRVVQFTGVPKYSKIQIGDTILTTEYSNIFPTNYPIGTVKSFELDNGTNFNAQIELFADMSKLRYVYAVQNPLQRERAELEQATDSNAENN